MNTILILLDITAAIAVIAALIILWKATP